MKRMRRVLIMPLLGSFSFIFSMDLPFSPIQAPLFGNTLNLENPDNLKRGKEIASQFEFYDRLSWQGKELCDGLVQKACEELNFKKPRLTSFLAFRETQCAYAQAYIGGEPSALALLKSMHDKVAAESKAQPELFKTTELEECCDQGAYKFCDAHLDEYKTQATLRICKEVELLPMTYEQMADYLQTTKDTNTPRAQRMFDEIHLILRIKHPSRRALQVAEDLIWLEAPKAACLGALEASELHDRNGGLDLCAELTALVLWANKASGKNIEEMSNQDLMNNFLRILTGEKAKEASTKP